MSVEMIYTLPNYFSDYLPYCIKCSDPLVISKYFYSQKYTFQKCKNLDMKY